MLFLKYFVRSQKGPSLLWVYSQRNVSRKKKFLYILQTFRKISHFFPKMTEAKIFCENHRYWSCILSFFWWIFAKISLSVFTKFTYYFFRKTFTFFRIYFCEVFSFFISWKFRIFFTIQSKAKFCGRSKRNAKILRDNFFFSVQTLICTLAWIALFLIHTVSDVKDAESRHDSCHKASNDGQGSSCQGLGFCWSYPLNLGAESK